LEASFASTFVAHLLGQRASLINDVGMNAPNPSDSRRTVGAIGFWRQRGDLHLLQPRPV